MLVNYVSADFNGDHKLDYALILEDTKNDFAVWVLQSEGSAYQAIRLHEIEGATLPIDMGLELVPKGELDYIDLDADDTKTITLKYQALQVSFFERAAATYYWQNGKYKSVTTGD
ncbi:hypothetical protein [Mucilaginibacter lacusdianchii]|uniref:hypothetical protein n=1 Tax=Mucilaginibacter lacusdianchii TaxID=2684211 RepID=UPI00131DFB7A|nr:hypothetical protein [Mucilaginibacter sp. JXJ CY 39]